MSKRRKYDVKNKRNFIIIIGLSIAIVGIFSLFIYNYTKASKIEYLIESGSLLQDVDKNYLVIDDDATLKARWDGNYYLIYNEKKVMLGKKIIAFNTITNVIKMYGKFYEIASDGKIIERKNENILESIDNAVFYKLDDRKYLLIDNKISSIDNSIETSNYLLVELDKMGNAKLSNNSINLKTISPTVLVTSDYTFDIANEILTYGEFNIDLKKIIGTTNQYKPDNKVDNETEDNRDNNDNSGVGNNGTGVGNGQGIGGTSGNGGGQFNSGIGSENGTGGIINDSDIGEIPDKEEIFDKIKNSSIINIVEGVTQIDVDYFIFDPYNEYESVYMELVSVEKGIHNKVILLKNETRVTFGDLIPGVEYELNFVTKVVGDEAIADIESIMVETKGLNYSMSIYKMYNSTKKMVYKVNLEKDFEINTVDVIVDIINEGDESSVCRNKKKSVNVSYDDLYRGYVTGEFDFKDCNIDDETSIDLIIENVKSEENGVIAINKSFSYKIGGTDEERS